jgi:hypothetical protein
MAFGPLGRTALVNGVTTSSGLGCRSSLGELDLGYASRGQPRADRGVSRKVRQPERVLDQAPLAWAPQRRWFRSSGGGRPWGDGAQPWSAWSSTREVVIAGNGQVATVSHER